MTVTRTAFDEHALADALETLLGSGAVELDAFVAGLNTAQSVDPHGTAWTTASLAGEIARLGQGTGRHGGVSSHPVVSQPFVERATNADDLLRTGLLDLWYVVASSGDVGARPLGIKRLGRNLVLFRDAAGTVHALEDFCPHRGAPLSLGHARAQGISCAYHGFEIDTTGTIVATPATLDCPLVGQQTTRVYPVREIAGAIFVFFSDRPPTAVPEPALPEEFTSPEWSGFYFFTEWQCNWQVALDNRVDPMHGSILHAGSYTLALGRMDAELEVEPTPFGFETKRNNQRGLNIDWHDVEFRPGNMLLVRTEIPYPASIGGGWFRINGHPTPIDEHRTLVWFHRSRKISGFLRDLWRFMYLNRLEARADAVIEQDRIMLESIPLAARAREKLAQSDIAVGRLRRLLRQEAERQIAAR